MRADLEGNVAGRFHARCQLGGEGEEDGPNHVLLPVLGGKEAGMLGGVDAPAQDAREPLTGRVPRQGWILHSSSMRRYGPAQGSMWRKW